MRASEASSEGPATPLQAAGSAPRRLLASEPTAETVMTPCMMCVQEDLSVEAARRVFADTQIAILPVVNRHGGPVGFLSRAALVRASRRGLKDPVVGQVMSPIQATVSCLAALSLVELLVERYSGFPLPVIDEEGRLLGLVDGALAGAAWRFRP
jgi:CBS domain-containing protein